MLVMKSPVVIDSFVSVIVRWQHRIRHKTTRIKNNMGRGTGRVGVRRRVHMPGGDGNGQKDAGLLNNSVNFFD